jgi:hypothetical protein
MVSARALVCLIWPVGTVLVYMMSLLVASWATFCK